MEPNRLEIRAELVAARDSQSLVRVTRSVEGGYVNGYVVAVGSDWFAMCHVADLIVFNGFQLFRSRDVTYVENPAPFGAFMERALTLRGFARPPTPALDLTDAATVLRSASAANPVVTVHREIVDPDVCHIGAVEQLVNGTLVLKLISPGGEWLDERETFPLHDITRIDFGGHYEEALRLVALSGPPATRAP